MKLHRVVSFVLNKKKDHNIIVQNANKEFVMNVLNLHLMDFIVVVIIGNLDYLFRMQFMSNLPHHSCDLCRKSIS